MTTLFVTLEVAGGNSMMPLLMMVAIFAIMWFFMIRPQQKKQKEIQNFRNSITIGAEIVTAGGIYGKVKNIDEMKNILMIEITNGVTIKVDRNSVYASAQPAQ